MFTPLTGLAQNPRYAKLLKSLEAVNDGSGDLEVLVSEELDKDPYVSPAEMLDVVAEAREYAAWKASLKSLHTWDTPEAA